MPWAFKEVIFLKADNPDAAGRQLFGKRQTCNLPRGLSFRSILFEASVEHLEVQAAAVDPRPVVATQEVAVSSSEISLSVRTLRL
jgi:hypothetical protein